MLTRTSTSVVVGCGTGYIGGTSPRASDLLRLPPDLSTTTPVWLNNENQSPYVALDLIADGDDVMVLRHLNSPSDNLLCRVRPDQTFVCRAGGSTDLISFAAAGALLATSSSRGAIVEIGDDYVGGVGLGGAHSLVAANDRLFVASLLVAAVLGAGITVVTRGGIDHRGAPLLMVADTDQTRLGWRRTHHRLTDADALHATWPVHAHVAEITRRARPHGAPESQAQRRRSASTPRPQPTRLRRVGRRA